MTALIKVLKFEKPLVLCSCVITTFFRSLYLQFGKSFCFQIFATFLADVQACAEKFVGLLLYSNQSTTMPNKKTFFCVPNQEPMITLTNAHGNDLRPIEKIFLSSCSEKPRLQLYKISSHYLSRLRRSNKRMMRQDFCTTLYILVSNLAKCVTLILD